MPIPKQTQTIQKFNAARSTWADVTSSAKLALAPLAVFGFGAMSNAGAQATTWDISSAQTTVTTLIGVGVAITIAMVVFKIGKRAANKV